VSLSDVLCDPLWFNDLDFTTKDTKVITKSHKGLFQQPQCVHIQCYIFLLLFEEEYPDC
jgi:hypothetical protein